jgi:putative pyruvate formate lyase activating enzyme
MRGCTLCPRQCGIDRSKARGACRAGEEILVGAVVIHKGEEPPLVAGAGSGAIFFCGCPMRCSYCQNKQISHFSKGRVFTPDKLADAMLKLEELGCSNINLVSPTHYTPSVITAIEKARALGMKLPILVNSSGYETRECLGRWKGHAQIYLMDLKYGDNPSGKVLSGVDDYWDVAMRAITYLFETAGVLGLDGEGKASSGLMVRHLVLPGMLSNPFSVLEFLSGLSLEMPVSIMSQYNPEYYRGDLSEMRRRITSDEYGTVIERATALGFETLYYQDMEAPSTYNPDFSSERPFADMIKLF